MKKVVYIALVYVIFGFLWVGISDQLAFVIWQHDLSTLQTVQHIKGYVFVLLSAVLISYLARQVILQVAARKEVVEHAIHKLPLGIAVSRMEDGKTVLMNPQFTKIYGWPQEKLTDVDSFFNHVYPDDEYRKKMRSKITADIESGDEQRMHWENITITTAKGQNKIVDAQNILLREQGLMISTVTDVTGRYTAFNALKKTLREKEKARELFEQIFENIPVMVTIYDPQLRDFRVNKQFVEVMGWNNQELKNIDLLKESYRDEATRKRAAEFMSHSNIGWEEFEAVDKHGKTHVQRWTNVRLTDETQVGIGLDITELRETQSKELKSREMLRKTFDSLQESVIIVDPENRTIKDCNKITEEIFGYSREELIGQSTELLHVDYDHFIQFDKSGSRELDKKGSFQTNFILKRKNGQVFPSSHTVSVVYDEQNEATSVVSVVRDITNQVKAEQQKMAAIMKAEDKLRHQIAREIHDSLVQMLSITNLFLEGVSDHSSALPEKDQERLEKSRGYLRKSIDESRELSHRIMPRSVDDHGLVEALRNLVNDIDQNTAVNLSFECTLAQVSLENHQQMHLYRIASEAINNALKHAGAKNIRLSLMQTDHILMLTVSDDGKGISAKSKKQAEGIGLDIMKSRADSIGAQLEVNSRKGKGTWVKVKLPLNHAT